VAQVFLSPGIMIGAGTRNIPDYCANRLGQGLQLS